MLGGTQGTLVVDAYTGYNRVTAVDGRSRSSCLAHVRRYFFEALTSHPVEARHVLDLILDIYRVEHEAKKRGIVHTPGHLELRQTRGREAMNAFFAWLDDHKDAFPPKSAHGASDQLHAKPWRHAHPIPDLLTYPSVELSGFHGATA